MLIRMNNANTTYRIEKHMISQTPTSSRPVYFLDAIRYDRYGKYSDNIMSGTQADCEKEMARRQGGGR
jgi:hypothetical protein